ncbi:MAG: DUF192 domain-containing protein [Magnetospirillum sp.]|nr:DUF192 domain-containing protein [Magnetospirillum sp.]
MAWIRVLMAALVLAAVPAAAQVPAPMARATVEVVTAGGVHHPFTVELAATPEQAARGLMYRKTLAADAGMLFDFGATAPVSMWMKNTLIPLDMLFLDDRGIIRGIAERTVPLSQTIIPSPGPVRSVLEVNSGTASRLGIKVGDRVTPPRN